MIESFVGVSTYNGRFRNIDFRSLAIGTRKNELCAREQTLSIEEKEELEELRTTWSKRSQHPTIYLTFHTDKAPCTEEEADVYIGHIKEKMSKIAKTYSRMINRELLPHDLATNLERMERLDLDYAWHSSLSDMCEIVAEFYGKGAVILIDEYDSCLNFEKKGGMHPKVKVFLTALLCEALKSNCFVHKSVMMGITRFVKNGLLSGLNNLFVSDVISPGVLAPVFGFSEDEVDMLVKHKQISNVSRARMREMYSGYIVGNARLYNPWSVMYCLEGKETEAFWSASGTVEGILRKLKSDFSTLSSVAKFWKGEEKVVINVYKTREVFDDNDVLLKDFFWVTLLQTGFLTVAKPNRYGTKSLELKIPNKEMSEAFENLLSGLLPGDKSSEDVKSFLLSFATSGNVTDLVSAMEKVLLASSSKNLTREQSYHNLLFGMLYSSLPDWIITSEGESGHGYFDICMIPKEKNKKFAVVIELKHSLKETETDLQQLANLALNQIQKKMYTNAVKEHKNITRIICLGVAFRKKT
eukprot:CAMPEP_0113889492 /NCGR_PEP_ID=MMETSP0780_2-20120614/13531_1 /TAXON_ID=652834 /ORGANISM="Palpitomonas bilix" /LENGTH=525 /DNA_ID=CAMNT_0000878605 /DNA_START=237 /DNA_END=1810 /DNA_ORIENTATION=- /assembly_acc=CAM_ASM_000599